MSFEKVPNFLVNLFKDKMNGNGTPAYRFDSFLLDVAERQLFHADIPVPLTPKAFDVLVYLVEHSGHLVLKDELMQAVWPDSFVDEVNLPRTIHTLRKALGEDHNGNKFIETVPTKGYRFIADVEEVSGNGGGLSTLGGDVEKSDPRDVDSKIEDLHDSGKRNVRRGRSWTWLILTITAIVTISAGGFWIANRSRTAASDVKASAPLSNNGEAYQFYLQGRFLLERRYAGDFQNALADFEKAIELDPNFAAAYAGKADAGINLFSSGDSRSHDDMGQVRTAINKAVELDESNSYAHAVACRIKSTYDWDFTGADKECRRAIELDPNDPNAQREFAMHLNVLGRADDALAAIDRAVALAPTSVNKQQRGILLYFSRRYDEAIAQFQQVEETDPDYNASRRWLMSAYEMKKDYADALECYIRQKERVAKVGPDNVTAIRIAFDEKGWPSVLQDMLDGDGSGKNNLFLAGTLAQFGDSEKSFAVLDSMVVNRRPMIIHMEREPRLDPIRNDPRFNDVLRRIGLR